MDLIEEVRGHTDFEIFLNTEDLTSRLDRINRAEAIVIFGLEIQRNSRWPYRLVNDLDTIEPPIIPLGAKYKFFPGDRFELRRQVFGEQTRSFLNRLKANCPEKKIPARTEWVADVLRRNGYETVLTGDPAWYDPDMLGEEFHRPEEINQLVLTTPHSSLFLGQCEELIRELSIAYADANRIVSFHSAPDDMERSLAETAKQNGWQISYASHDTKNIDFYQDSDIHIGYRFHGHLAHLRWRRPSVLLAEDSRGAGLNETLGTAGVPAAIPRQTSGLKGLIRRSAGTFPVDVLQFLLLKIEYTDDLRDQELKAKPNPSAVRQVIDFVERQKSENWSEYKKIRRTIDNTYKQNMRPYLCDMLGSI